jgi:hypothetical protein
MSGLRIGSRRAHAAGWTRGRRPRAGSARPTGIRERARVSAAIASAWCAESGPNHRKRLTDPGALSSGLGRAFRKRASDGGRAKPLRRSGAAAGGDAAGDIVLFRWRVGMSAKHAGIFSGPDTFHPRLRARGRDRKRTGSLLAAADCRRSPHSPGRLKGEQDISTWRQFFCRWPARPLVVCSGRWAPRSVRRSARPSAACSTPR